MLVKYICPSDMSDRAEETKVQTQIGETNKTVIGEISNKITGETKAILKTSGDKIKTKDNKIGTKINKDLTGVKIKGNRKALGEVSRISRVLGVNKTSLSIQVRITIKAIGETQTSNQEGSIIITTVLGGKITITNKCR